LTAARYDLVIVGGGIHGAGVAQAAAAHGYTALVLEQSGIAAGTSSRSSKLIHGGLRYLESHQWSLVRECLRERAILLRNAPELVHLAPFFIPIYKHSKRRPVTIHTGLTLYSMLGGLGKTTRFHRLPRSQWPALDGLDTANLRAVYQYHDARTDDAALTVAVMNAALQLGAQLALPAQLVNAATNASGVDVSYTVNGVEKHCQASVLVNAAGPWVSDVLRRVTPATPQLQMQLVQGTHIIVDGTINKGVFYLEAPADRRPVFVMPWRDQVMVGTTETLYQGDPANVEPRVDERTYLLETLSWYFPHYRSTETARIRSAFAGLRVLPLATGSVGARSRDTLLHPDNSRAPRVLTIYGGKLTAYRQTAENVIKRLQPVLPERKAVADTRDMALRPGPLNH
jgi:glycerol-3-phosphate dehydrogenase